MGNPFTPTVSAFTKNTDYWFDEHQKAVDRYCVALKFKDKDELVAARNELFRIKREWHFAAQKTPIRSWPAPALANLRGALQ